MWTQDRYVFYINNFETLLNIIIDKIIWCEQIPNSQGIKSKKQKKTYIALNACSHWTVLKPDIKNWSKDIFKPGFMYL